MKTNQPKRLFQDSEAVSPVVATLMLVLVAAGAAVGLGVFMNGFQEDAENAVNADVGGDELLIGGSSTVYEFTKVAKTPFERSNPGISVVSSLGGSGAGRHAVCNGLVDIGASSSSPKDSDFDACLDNLGKELKVHKVATDGVVFATLSTNTHCTGGLALTKDDALEIYIKNADAQGTWTGSITPTDTFTTGMVEVTWADLDGVNGMTCAGTEAITIFDREDPGGTSEIASEKLFGQKQNQLEDFGLTLPASQQGDGNQGVLETVEGHANADHALFFTSFGYAESNSLDVHAFAKTGTPVQPTSSNIGDESYDATRPILYLTAGDPIGAAKVYLKYVMDTHNNQEFAAEADFESIF